MAARLAIRTYDCRSRTPRFLASRVSPLIAACKRFASVGKVMSLVTCFLFSDRSLLENSSLAACAIRAVGRGRTMKRSRFTEAQIAFILRQGEEGTAVGEVCRKAGISGATYYNWRKKYGGLMPSEMKRLRQLEEENGKLKKIVADLSLDKEMLQDVIRRKL